MNDELLRNGCSRARRVKRAARSRRLFVVAIGAVAACFGLGHVSNSAAATQASRSLVFYTVVGSQQFVNNEDDRARGQGNNPFGNYRGTGLATTDEHVGPLPGDEGLYNYRLYANTSVKKQVGTALLVCQYNFGKNGLCDVSYQLDGGSLVGVGEFNALTKQQFSLAITGGTGIYAGYKGTVEASHDNIIPTLGQIQIVSHTVPALVLESQRLSFTLHRAASLPAPAASKPAAGSANQFSVYAVTEQEQFIDNADDEARGWIANPFGLVDRSVEFAESEDHGGPYPGDAALFSINLYTAPDLKSSAGSAVLTCFYAFNQNAFCDATYQLKAGLLIGGNEVGFNAKSFALAITGGTGKYLTMTGDVMSVLGAKQVQRLDFALQPS